MGKLEKFKQYILHVLITEKHFFKKKWRKTRSSLFEFVQRYLYLEVLTLNWFTIFFYHLLLSLESDVFPVYIIRIYHEREGTCRIENSSRGSLFGITRFAEVHTNNEFFSLLTTVFIYLIFCLFILK